jgi:dolichol-phosphate mannosyltransferase
MRHDSAVILATFNESGTVGEVVSRLLAATQSAGHASHILVVDDSSPDGTADLVRRRFSGEPRVEVFLRPEREGLGAACLAGFHRLLRRRFDRIATLDADLSHEPERLPALLELGSENDLVIGSRYVPGGEAPGLTLSRRLISRAANHAWRRLAGLRVFDLTSGMRCYRSAALADVLGAGDFSRDYAFLSELAFHFLRRGYRVREVPISFKPRAGGSSKLSSRTVLDSACTLFRLWHRYGRARPCDKRLQRTPVPSSAGPRGGLPGRS